MFYWWNFDLGTSQDRMKVERYHACLIIYILQGTEAGTGTKHRLCEILGE